MDILIVAVDNARWGSARLLYGLKKAGLEVAALCPADNALAASSHLARHFKIPDSKSWWRLAKSLAEAITEAKPALIIPADEYVVALLHAFVRRGPNRYLGSEMLRQIEDSLCAPEHFDSMLLKSDTLVLAKRLGLRVPDGGRIRSPATAAAMASELGYPLFIKHSFGWAGGGVVRLDGDADLQRMLQTGSRWGEFFRPMLRIALGRDWYPRSASRDLQKAIKGTPGMFSAVAWRGRMLGGFAGLTISNTSSTGPSTALRLGPHSEMAAVAATMIEAFGATGFIGFDFMIDEATGHAYLLECNARPVQAVHLGATVGVDLAALLAGAIKGDTLAKAAATADRICDVALFPYAMEMTNTTFERDIPWHDPGLLQRYHRTSHPVAVTNSIASEATTASIAS